MTGERLFVGLMSGTSADSVDAALVAFDGDGCRLVGSHNHSLPADLKHAIHDLTYAGPDEIARAALLDERLGEVFAEATLELLSSTGTLTKDVEAVGSHGQTIRHEPGHKGGRRYTVQIGNPHIIAETTGILTVADFRRRDIACGGQGAPLAPAFHRAQFADASEFRCVANIGGIANITLLPASDANGETVIGFDTGPGNTLLDAWIDSCRNQPYDKGGAWAASGTPVAVLLERMREHPYLAQPAPKSTGREDFNLRWLQNLLDGYHQPLRQEDVQATLLEFTVTTLADAIKAHCQTDSRVFICGGGAHNDYLLARLALHLPGMAVETTEALGIHPDWVEAAAFAWLAKQHLDKRPGNLPAVTGARKAVVLGATYPV